MFPVPDQDTGSNMVKTLQGAAAELQASEPSTYKHVIESALNGALTSASGNVGIIFTGFLSGFLPELSGDASVADLKRGFAAGSIRARQSIQHPKTGTILDAIDAAAEEAKHIGEISDIEQFFGKTLAGVRKAVALTQEKMDLYRKAAVVDAGAYGFLIFLEGMLEGIDGKVVVDPETIQSHSRVRRFIQILENRYEVVGLLTSTTKTREQVLAILSPLGDSIDIAVFGSRMKIHIHTDKPEEVTDHIESWGEVSQLTTQDMTKHVGGRDNTKGGVGIVIDSGSDFDPDMALRERIEIVPFTVYADEKTGPRDMNKEDIYAYMRRIRTTNDGWPKTSQPMPVAYLAAYRTQLARFGEVVCIAFASTLSGSYNSALQARDMLSDTEKKRVFVFDSLLGSGAIALLAKRAHELANRENDADSIIAELYKLRKRACVMGIPQDIQWLVRGGRLKPSIGRIFSILQMLFFRPIIGLRNHKLTMIGFRFSGASIADNLFMEYKSRKQKMGKIIYAHINHNDNPKEAAALAKLMAADGAHVVAVTLSSHVIGAQTGPGGVFCSFISYSSI